MPLSFEANAGQTDSRVKFLSRGPGYTLFLTGNEAVLALGKAESRKQKAEARRSRFETRNPKFEIGDLKLETGTHIPRPLILSLGAPMRGSEPPTPDAESRASSVLRMKLLGANPAARVTGAEELPGKANYFIGNDPKKWHSNVPTYAKVRYQDVYRGVDLVYHGNQGGQLEYDFVVAPGADPGAIALDVAAGLSRQPSRKNGGVKPPLQITTEGDLVIPTDGGELRFHKPVVYQEQLTVDSRQLTVRDQNRKSKFENRNSAIENQQSVEGRFVLDAENRVHFALGPYDRTRPLVIDPVLVYSTYLGGSGTTWPSGIAVDSSGNAYVTGNTVSSDFPTASPLQANLAGLVNAFVSKLNWDASTFTLSLVYSTYLGGSSYDYGQGIAVDSSGNAYVTGPAQSSDFPTAHPLQASLAGGANAFVAELNSTGSALVYSTYLGGSGWDLGYGIAVDSSGNAYVTGWTGSSDFPTANPLQANLGGAGATNAFVSKLNWAASTSTLSLVYSTYLGGSGADHGMGIAVDPSRNAYVAGGATSSNFPTAHPLQASLAGYWNAFVAKLNWDASTSTLSLVYSTYLGGSSYNEAGAIAVDSSGNAYLAGTTESSDFPTAYPIQANLAGYANAFVSKLNWAASTSTLRLVYSTYLGGSGFDQGAGITVDSSGNAYVIGSTASTDFPTAYPIQANRAPTTNAFVSKLNWAASTSTLSLVYSTYLGGSGEAYGTGIAVDPSGNAYVTGGTTSSNFPTANPLQASSKSASSNAFVAKIGPANSPGIAFGPGALSLGTFYVGTSSASQPVTLTAAGSQPLNVSSITPSGDFALATTATSCPYSGGTVPSGSTCTLDVTFTPTAAGTRTGSVFVNDNASGSPQTVALSGKGVAQAALNPASYNFGYVDIKTPSNAHTFTLKNNESTALNISSIGFTGANTADFSQTNTCGTLPTSLAAGAWCSLSVTFTPSVLGLESATLTVNDNAPAPFNTLTSALSGAGVADATLAPASSKFAYVAIDTPSSVQTFTLKNNELTALNISSIGFTGANGGDFSQTGGTCGTAPTSLAVGKSCTIGVTLTPSVLGPESATLTVNDNASTPYNELTSALSGGGVADATLAPASTNFSGVAVHTLSNPKRFTLHNNELTPLSISGIAFTGTNAADFSQTGGTCGTPPTSLAAGATCTISVKFTPSVLGAESATLTVNDNAPAAQYQTLTSSLTGTGLPDVTLKPASTSLGNTPIHTPSSPSNFTLNNYELVPLSISSITFTGANAGDFSQTGGSCGTPPTTLAANTWCSIGVTFTPSVHGAETATLTVNDSASAPYNTLSSSLSGAGVPAVALAPASYNFGNVAIHTASSPESFTLTNHQLVALSISTITFTGADPGDFSQTGGTCGTPPTSLAAKSSCTVSVTFKPLATGKRTATLNVNDSANNTPQTVSLTGTGQ
jgi:hypothetical protein